MLRLILAILGCFLLASKPAAAAAGLMLSSAGPGGAYSITTAITITPGSGSFTDLNGNTWALSGTGTAGTCVYNGGALTVQSGSYENCNGNTQELVYYLGNVYNQDNRCPTFCWSQWVQHGYTDAHNSFDNVSHTVAPTSVTVQNNFNAADPGASGYELVFDDEFTSLSTINTSTTTAGQMSATACGGSLCNWYLAADNWTLDATDYAMAASWFTIGSGGLVITPTNAVSHNYAAAVTFTGSSPTVTSTLAVVANQTVYFGGTGTMPTGLSAATPYYVNSTGLSSGTSFQVCAASGCGGGSIVPSTSGSGALLVGPGLAAGEGYNYLYSVGWDRSCTPTLCNLGANRGTHWQGSHILGGGVSYYVEFQVSFNNSTLPISGQWPAFVYYSWNGAAGFNDQWSGQAAGYHNRIENDLLEYTLGSINGLNTFSSAIHNWYGASSSDCQLANNSGIAASTTTCNTGNAYNKQSATLNWSTPQRIGQLYLAGTAANGWVGSIQTYFNGVPTGQITSWNGGTTVSFTGSSPTVTSTSPVVAGQIVYFGGTGTMPTGFTAGTPYYVISTGLLSGTHFEVSATSGGSAITPSTAGSGTLVVASDTYGSAPPPTDLRKIDFDAQYASIGNPIGVPMTLRYYRVWQLAATTNLLPFWQP